MVGLLVKPSELGTARDDPPAPGEMSRCPVSGCQRVDPRLTRSRVNLHTRAETLPLIFVLSRFKGTRLPAPLLRPEELVPVGETSEGTGRAGGEL